MLSDYEQMRLGWQPSEREDGGSAEAVPTRAMSPEQSRESARLQRAIREEMASGSFVSWSAAFFITKSSIYV